MMVRTPASSANLGPGFDCLALAVDLPFELSDAEPTGSGRRWSEAEPTHPTRVAFVDAGGDPAAPLWWRSRIPPGRGLGFSGAARVAGAYLAGRQDGLGHLDAVDGARVVATRLEGHPDNAAASALGGFTVAAGEEALRLRPPAGLSLLAWWPEAETATDASRRALPERVALADAAFSLARAATWVAAMATGELAALRRAGEDRLHQPVRLARRPEVAAALDAFLAHPDVLVAWLSGSGPTVAALVPARAAADVCDALVPATVSRLGLADVGVAMVDEADAGR